MSLTGIALLAAGIVFVVLAAVQLITVAAHTSFIGSVIIGEDGRTSTSKTFILMWTLLVAWALLALLIAGEFVSQHACVIAQVKPGQTRCGGDEVGLLQLGWTNFLHAGLSGSYLILLGVPAAAGVAAKGISQSQAQSATAVKTVKPPGRSGIFTRIAEIFSADDGSTDIADFQYLIFNLITAAYFVAQFLKPAATGLPTIPDTLLGLTSVSASLYVGKKAVTRTQPTISGVFPTIIQDGQPFTILGSGLTADPSSPTNVEPRVAIDGVPATGVREVDGNLVANAPHNLSVGGAPTTRQLIVLSPYGAITSNFPVQCL